MKPATRRPLLFPDPEPPKQDGFWTMIAAFGCLIVTGAIVAYVILK